MHNVTDEIIAPEQCAKPVRSQLVLVSIGAQIPLIDLARYIRPWRQVELEATMGIAAPAQPGHHAADRQIGPR
jgi:hypothetical protein